MAEDITNTAGSGSPTPTAGDRLFSQEEVNRIVQERLAKEKAKADSAFAEREKALAEREQAYMRKELTDQATARLTACGLNTELLSLVDLSDKEAMDRTLKILEKSVPQKAGGMRMSGSGMSPPPLSWLEDPIRQGMGLKKE